MARKNPKSKKQTTATEKFERDLLIRGEAAERKQGKLPPGATHEIVKRGSKGIQLVRRRFSAV